MMSEKTRLGLWVMGAGLALGLAGDALLRATPWGLNFALWVGGLAAAAIALKRRARKDEGGRARCGFGGEAGGDFAARRGSDGGGLRGERVPGGALAGGLRRAFADEGAWALPCAFLFAAAFVWRDSPALLALDGLAVLALFSVALLGGRGGRVLRAGVTDYWLAGAAAALAAVFAPILLGAADVKWDEVPREGRTRHALAALRGLLMAAPLLLLFGGLFAAADVAYAGLVSRTFALDPELAVSHVCLTLFFAWVSAGYLRGLLLARAGASAGGRAARFVLGFCSDAGRRPATAGLNLGAAAGARAAAADGGRKTEAGAGYWPPPPSVTELTGEGARQAPPSVVGEPPRPAKATPAPETEIAAKARRGGTAETTETAGTAGTLKTASTPEAGGSATDGAQAQVVGSGASAAQAANSGDCPAADAWGRMRLGVVEVGVALGLLNVLFASFVAVQIRYLFGGAAAVAQTAGMTYSEYARRGFFELVWVAALVLPLLLGAHWLMRKERPAHEPVFRALAGGLLSMLFVVLASALWRMRLYQGEYGQTELRFYTTAFIGWLALVFVWFALTVLRGRRDRFAFGALVAWLAVLCVLNAVNPSARIVRANAALARERGTFDAAYATSLGADAIPALLDAAPLLGRDARAEVARTLLGRDREDADWRSWNLARARARRALAEDESLLREWSAPPPDPQPAPDTEAARAPSPPEPRAERGPS